MLAGCGSPHGPPSEGSEALAPNEVLDFARLYAENCAACHGAEGRGGAAIALADPVYLAIADDAVIRKVIANGVSGTAMPAFAQSAGGMLTDAQIDVISKGIRVVGASREIFDTAPPRHLMRRKSAGDAQRGEVVYKTFCSSCHGPGGAVEAKAAPLPMVRFWLSSAIKVCAPSLSPDAPNWERPTGGETSPANRCPIKKLPT